MKIKKVSFIKSAAGPSGYPRIDLPEVAFAGRSNVGKSSLINTLINRKGFAKTSSTPGKTRLINFFDVNNAVCFVDLPGYGYAKVPKSMKKDWKPLVEHYLSTRKNLCLLILILDIRRVPSQDDLDLLEWLEEYGIPAVVALTKTDKVGRSLRQKQLSIAKETINRPLLSLIPFSSKNGEGKQNIWKEISRFALPREETATRGPSETVS